MKVRTVLLILLLLARYSYGQKSAFPARPEVGRQMPDIRFDNVRHFTMSSIHLKDFSGKWVVLFFWISYCPNCTNQFAILDDLQKKFKDKIQVILIGSCGKGRDTFESTSALFERMRSKLNLNLPVAYDSTLLPAWNIWSFPRIVVIDDKGIVKVDNGSLINEGKMLSLMKGKSVSLSPAPPEVLYEPGRFFNFSKNATDSLLISGSVLSRYYNETPLYSPLQFEKSDTKYFFRLQGVSLATLYRYAYVGRHGWYLLDDPLYGKLFPEPVLELQDTSQFSCSYVPDVGFRGYFNYSIHTAACDTLSSQDIMKTMQSDLRKSFGYEVSFEIREMPCWILEVHSNEKARVLKTKGGQKKVPKGTAGGFTLTNVPVKTLASIMAGYLIEIDRRPILDETGMRGNIDITVDALMSDLPAVTEALHSNGLRLRSDLRKMKVMVIKHPAKRGD